MACILYRKGKGTLEHGIECESTTCEIEHMEGLLSAGWSTNPPGYEPPSVATLDEDDEADVREDVGINPVRLAAKEACIEGWDIKRIHTLQKLLEA